MSKNTLIGGAMLGTTALLLSGCGGGSSASMPPVMPPVAPPSQVQQIDTQQLLAIAKVPTDASDPKAVGSKVLVVADADDETSDPLLVG